MTIASRLQAQPRARGALTPHRGQRVHTGVLAGGRAVAAPPRWDPCRGVGGKRSRAEGGKSVGDSPRPERGGLDGRAGTVGGRLAQESRARGAGERNRAAVKQL